MDAVPRMVDLIDKCPIQAQEGIAKIFCNLSNQGIAVATPTVLQHAHGQQVIRSFWLMRGLSIPWFICLKLTLGIRVKLWILSRKS